MLTDGQLRILNKVRKLNGSASFRDLQSNVGQGNLKLLADRGLIKATFSLTGAGEVMCKAAGGKGQR